MNSNRNQRSYPGDLHYLPLLRTAKVRSGHPIKEQKESPVSSELVEIPQHETEDKGGEDEEENEGEGIADDHQNEDGDGEAR